MAGAGRPMRLIAALGGRANRFAHGSMAIAIEPMVSVAYIPPSDGKVFRSGREQIAGHDVPAREGRNTA
jgi:hypothetical protein